MRLIWLFAASVVSSIAACRAVDGDFILARDVAMDVIAFGVLEPDLHIGFAPLPGTRRTFTGQELAAFAKGRDIPVEALIPSICFERAVQPLSADPLQKALEAGLNLPGASIEIVDYSRDPVPSGQLDFPRSGLGTPSRYEPDTPIIWRGRLKYAQHSTIAVWVKVRISLMCQAVVATRLLNRRTIVSADDVQIVRRNLYPFAPRLDSLNQVLGRTIRRTTRAGMLLSNDLLEDPPEVRKGETVLVSSTSGAATVSFTATALTNGWRGESIALVNPQNHRVMKAIVTGSGNATVKL
ncbi:MAG TPA: flagellar basal body P-ring formation chaperone FlgA [Bryobacteraceae bacterium]|nr:flagellar basal body P-ring formation chaperone FlgA [Bryobacteraceae bacterium]